MTHKFCQLGQAVVKSEANAVMDLSLRINDSFADACKTMLDCNGRVIVMGMGKSGHIANKIAATLASTGTPAFYVHPGEACHGDFGMVTKDDVIVAISNSGESRELTTLLPLIKKMTLPLISLTGNLKSSLALASDIALDVSVSIEACPLGLAPTTSTTVALVMGDALAIALLDAKGFSAKDFARSHPGGSLGRKLLLHVSTISHQGDALPLVKKSATVSEALIEVTDKKLGMACVCDFNGKLCGVFTDGDVRRALNNNLNIHTINVESVMNKQCHTITNNMLAAEALAVMENHKITSLVIVDNDKHPIGVIHIHDLINAGVA